MPGWLTVKQVAEAAGVTPRAVRYYHAVGLLPEPFRDRSGYRRYGGREVLLLVRIARLRALGMPLAQIAGRLGDPEAEERSMTGALRALADEIDAEIQRLVATRDRLRNLAESEAFETPIAALTHALQAEGVLGPADRLGTGEGWAAAVADAVHPDGMAGLLVQVHRLFADPKAVAVLRPLRIRLERLSDRSTDAEIAALAGDVAALLPAGSVDPRINMRLLGELLADRFNPTQQRFLRRVLAEVRSAS